METAYLYLALSGVLTVLLWTPYILARMVLWGVPTFLNNYPKGYPAEQPEPPLWAQRSHRAHLNLVETMPAFIAVIVAAGSIVQNNFDAIALWAQVFFYSRIAHALVYILGIPYLRTPSYLISWAAILMIGVQVAGQVN
ncbi:MAPEG family protein [Aliikangiella coralliicola]|uniref:MAPEG family protein n=1 Tax=Aliikangiella coralliicola TaxID=2592383 RepID=A0A545U4G7_9GAMM|nr:MAPEG family protein [Aliikangiella coralliicola]TQV84346.1 MAPEG family protein [Aliikangiella coralliicola]